jgi:ubiquinone biosynthesis protein
MRRKKGGIGVKGLRRLAGMTRILARHGFGSLMDRLLKGTATEPEAVSSANGNLLPAPHRIRKALEELGPSFIKLGQLMSTRADILPKAHIEELQKLQDQVPPIPFDRIKPFMEAQFDRSLDEVFKSFDETCLAAASVAQVYRGVLHSGEEVAVKVVRPEIEKKIILDIHIMHFLARRLETAFEIARIIGAVNVVKEFERTVFNELDMHIEAGSIEKFSHHYRLVNEIWIPRVFWDHTSKAVLVMEYIPGVKVNQVEAIRDQGLDPCDIAMIGLRSLSRQLMEFGFVHADPHPGNTIVTPDGRVGLVDFGITAHLDEELMLQLAHLFLGYAEHDYDLVMDAILETGLIDEDTTDIKQFRNDLKEISEPFYGRSLQTISVKDVYDQIIRLIAKYRIRLPRNLLLLLKTFIQTEALGKILGSDASILQVIRPYARRLLQRGYESHRIFRAMGRDARATSNLMRLAPKFLHDILKQTARGRQGLELRHSGFEETSQRLEKGLNRMIIGIIIAASTIAAALVLNSPAKLLEFKIRLFNGETLYLVSVLGIVGYVIATILGIWLIISIIRSGRL